MNDLFRKLLYSREDDLVDFLEILEVLHRPMLHLGLKRARKPRPFDPNNPLDEKLTIEDLMAAQIRICRMPYIGAALGRMRVRNLKDNAMKTGKPVPKVEEVLVPLNQLKVTFCTRDGKPLPPDETPEMPWFMVEGPGVDAGRVKKVIFPDLTYDMPAPVMVQVEMWTQEYIPASIIGRLNTKP